MGSISGYRDLIAWQKAMDLVQAVYEVSARFPRTERFGLTAQVRRAAVSVPSNVAEGYSRPNRADYVHFLDIARGSANEVETQILIAKRLGFMSDEACVGALALAQEVQRLLAGLVKSLEKSRKTSIRD